jgi:hypothetical protein
VKIGWIKLHNDELHKFSSLPSIIGTVTLTIMKCARHVA